METSVIRASFLNFFSKLNHKIVESSPLISKSQNPMFTIAGIMQFKDYLLNPKSSPYSCYATAQKCLRAGGKHNDLQEVGKTDRHHTFFEMLGNFSMYEYGKQDAIKYAITFLTKVLNLDTKNIKITVHPKDKQTKIFIEKNFQGLIIEEDISNTWCQSDTGPWGYCTEIYYKRTDNTYIEIWNIVFVEYILKDDGIKQELGYTCIDTGMGLERVAAIMQGTNDNFEIDIFVKIKQQINQIIGDKISNINVVADHIRSIAFLYEEGLLPGNKSKEYVLRKIIRNAILNSNLKYPFLYKIVGIVPNIMDYYKFNNIINTQDILKKEEELFFQLLHRGESTLDKFMKNKTSISNKDIDFLHDTYGIPKDITIIFATNKNLQVKE